MEKLLTSLFFLLVLHYSHTQECLLKREYANIKHTFKIPYNYDSYSDIYVYGMVMQCNNITLKGNATLENYIKSELLEQSRITQYIYIGNSNIPTLESGALDPYFKARKLLLGKNGIRSIKPFVFSEMHNLTDLQLYDNELTELEENTFDGCVNLKIVNLANNKITTLKNINAPRLQKLHLENNKITSINANDFKNVPALRVLDLSNNSIAHLEQNLFMDLKNLSEVSFKFNNIKFVPLMFYNYLQKIDLSHNRISSLNCEKFGGSIDLSNNLLTSACNFVNATSIDLSYNRIPYINPTCFQGLNKLRTLNIHNNPLGEIHVNAFKDLFNLTSLNVSHCELNTIYIGTLHNLNNLEEFDFSNNYIEKLEHGVFTGLTNLRYLDMHNIEIKNLEIKILYPLSNLEVLIMKDNYIDVLDFQKFINHLPDLKVISIDFGSIGCHSLIKLLHLFQDKYIKVQKGTAINVHNINGIACDPNLPEDSILFDNSTEITKVSNDKQIDNNDVSNIANSIANIHSILVFTCVVFILFLIVKSALLIRHNFGQCRKNRNLPSCSLKLLNESE